jgi:hypothetical protein
MVQKPGVSSVESGDLSARIRAEHEHLMKEVREIRAIIAAETPAEQFPQMRVELVQRLRDLANDLPRHFDLEEAGGFMSEVLRKAPQKAHIVQRLLREHAEIARQLNAVVLDVEAVRDRDDWTDGDIPRRTTAVISLLEEHEAAEASLIQETYLQDEGGPD